MFYKMVFGFFAFFARGSGGAGAPQIVRWCKVSLCPRIGPHVQPTRFFLPTSQRRLLIQTRKMKKIIPKKNMEHWPRSKNGKKVATHQTHWWQLRIEVSPMRDAPTCNTYQETEQKKKRKKSISNVLYFFLFFFWNFFLAGGTTTNFFCPFFLHSQIVRLWSIWRCKPEVQIPPKTPPYLINTYRHV